MVDLLNQANRLLRPQGRLVFWLPYTGGCALCAHRHTRAHTHTTRTHTHTHARTHARTRWFRMIAKPGMAHAERSRAFTGLVCAHPQPALFPLAVECDELEDLPRHPCLTVPPAPPPPVPVPAAAAAWSSMVVPIL